MKRIIHTLIILCISSFLYAQQSDQDTLKPIRLNEVVITANRMPIALKNNPGAVSLVTHRTLSLIPKGIGAEEALRLVPGVRVDNQHDGSRVHISIRGQGILTERGLRGIGVLLDGIPLNDPSGFAPDLYDVDWATVQKAEVLRGPSAGLYGSSGAAGILNITTRNGGPHSVGGTLNQTVGSNGFFKTQAGLNGTRDFLNYRVGYSRIDGSGYRDHQAYWGNNLYEKITIKPSEKLSVTQIISHTDYFQQNPEGLSLSQLDNPRQANPDARPFNEYQKTNRTTVGFNGQFRFNKEHSIRAYSFYRTWNYKETSNKYAEYSNHTDPGAGISYNLNLAAGKIRHHLNLGTDLKWQTINMHKLKSAANPNRAESIDETNIETDTLLANQIISQHSTGIFVLYRMETGRFNILGNLRYDNLTNQLTDKIQGTEPVKTSMDFSRTSFRLGASYGLTKDINLFVNWSQGFMPPSTEELASNPLGYSGFNTHLIPATANCIEAGSRGTPGRKIAYDITGFIMHTRNDFFRFKQSGRGNQEVFYGNAGNSRRFGIETWISFDLLKSLNLQVAYTYADYKYTSVEIDPVYTDTNYVLTTPPAPGQYLPNSPKHQLYAEAVYKINKHFKVSLGTEVQSKWAIYTDATAYNGELDPAIYRNWQKGFNLYHARIGYLWKFHSIQGECSLAARNLTGEKHMAFTEPDPDGNAYQPGPGQEFFGNIRISF